MASTKGDSPIIIKKYANRRLYNTQSSSYITLDDLARMTREGLDFQVLDAKTGGDITHAILTQIIMEEEANGEQMLPVSFLRKGSHAPLYYARNLTHLPEILALHDLARDPWANGREHFERRSRDNLRHRGLHHHVFDAVLIGWMARHVGLTVLRCDSSPTGFFLLARTPS